MQRPRLALFRRFLGTGSGATAVEFALVAPPFIALLYAILQTTLIFFAQQVLQTATIQAARLIMTGQAQSGNYTASQFQQAVCANATSLFNCGGIYVNVQTFSSFSSVTMLNPVSNGTFSSSGMSYSPGGTGDIEVVQVFYQWPVYPGPLGFSLSNASGNNRVLVATAAFRNEP
jgi:Flp pilus assembly protein TadG